MLNDGKIYVGLDGEEPVYMLLNKANRHGLIAGATGTGKTVTLKVLAESFSDAGVPVFLADVKGDIAGMCQPGADSEGMQKRIETFHMKELGFEYRAFPTTFWDIFGERGLPLRTTITEMGPTLLARLMGLTTLQEDILNIVFRIADAEGLLLIDTKDLKAMLSYVAENVQQYASEYGNMSKASINVIIRGVTALESTGGEIFFGEPALDIKDWFQVDDCGKGMINILDSVSLINSPKMYATFMLWMLTELYETMPEVGDLDRPKMVFFFDEAHLLFNDMPKILLQKIEQVVKLCRSKGIGIFFITQTPKDIPDGVLSQLGNKIQHALHAYTPSDMKAVKVAADSFRPNPAFKTVDAIQELKTGEALVSCVEPDGSPAIVKRTRIVPPLSFMGAISDEEREKQISGNALYNLYKEAFDRDSAYEFLNRLAIQTAEEIAAEQEKIAQEKADAKARAEAEKQAEKERIAAQKAYEREIAAREKEAQKQREAAEKRKKQVAQNVAKTTGSTIGREVGKVVGNSIGGSFGKKLGSSIGSSLGRGILGNIFWK